MGLLTLLTSLAVVAFCLSPVYPAEYTYSSTDVPKAIPDGNSYNPGIVTSTIVVTDNGVVADVNVTLNVTHPAVAHIVAELIAPSGAVVLLLDETILWTPDLPNTTFDDEATAKIYSATPPFTGSYQPSDWYGGLAKCDGGSLSGTWTLRLKDRFDSITGTLNSWSLNITTLEGSGPAPTVALNPPSPDTLWPPNGKLKSVTISGSVTDAGGGIGDVWLVVDDEYDEYGGAANPVTLAADGTFSTEIAVPAARLEDDMDGRCYVIYLYAENEDGSETSSADVSVTVPHHVVR